MQTRILPTDNEGGFLLATFHGAYDEPTEVEHARFAAGTTANLQRLEDVAPLLTDGMRLPTRIHASRRGIVAAAFDQVPSGKPPFLRVVDLGARKVIIEERKPPNGMILKLGQPEGLSLDGRSVAYRHVGPGMQVEIRQHGISSGLPPMASCLGQHAVPFDGGWVVWNVQDAELRVMREGEVSGPVPLPRVSFDGTPVAAADGRRAALVTLEASVWLVSLDGGLRREFRPHKGLKRTPDLKVALSDCGRWMATRADGHLTVTDLETGQSWPAGHFPDRTIHKNIGDRDVGVVIPETFAFVGGRLLMTSLGAVHAIEVEANRAQAFISELGRAGAPNPVKAPAHAPLEKLAEAASIPQALPKLAPYFSPGVVIRTKTLGKVGWSLAPGAKASIGASRFGGWPDLPRKSDWPRWQGRPMGFVAQLNLEEAHSAGVSLRLPRRGLLSFFVGADEYSVEDEDGKARYAFDAMVDGWRVIFTPDISSLDRCAYTDLPLPPGGQPCGLKFTAGALPLPPDSSAAYDALRLSGGEQARYNELLNSMVPSNVEPAVDQLMGYSAWAEFPQEVACEQASRGLNDSQLEDGTPESDEVHRSAPRWALLLQVTSNLDAGFFWGDGRRLLFYGDRLAMERGDFSSVRVMVD